MVAIILPRAEVSIDRVEEVLHVTPEIKSPSNGIAPAIGGPRGELIFRKVKMSLADLRSRIGYVPQKAFLFSGTIASNIAFGAISKDPEVIADVVDTAQAREIVEQRDRKLDAEISQGGTDLSGGQRQLLTIARAVLANRPILILDGATSNVDTRTEWHIQHAMDRLMAHRTSFVIAHRLSTIRDADLILVLHDGDIVEKGTHDELLAKGGFYANLYQSQFDTVA
jgi:ATP-binding cassette subfamily B multidrug efflux pump